MRLLTLKVIVFWFGALLITDSDGAWVYPIDDYTSPVNFSLALPVTVKDLRFVNFNEIGQTVNSSQLKDYPTKVLIHGWLTSIELSPWYPLLKVAYLKEPSRINIIYVDYKGISANKYSIASASSKNVAKVIADYLLSLNITLDNFHLIGHSLGSHVAGYAGREIFTRSKKKVGRITHLDAAGQKFNVTSNIINSNDAKFVDVIHSDDNYFGLKTIVGHVDMFPNGGTVQPGCPSLEVDENCSHARSTRFFHESIGNKAKIARKAASWEDYRKGIFLDKEFEVVGEHVTQTARGHYYFVTNDDSPYLTKH